jgi:hypothetical protein
MQTELERLQERLDRLERRARAQRVLTTGAVLAGLCLAAVPGGTQGEGYEVRAPFRVVGQNGRVLFQVDTVRRPMRRLDEKGELAPTARSGQLEETRLLLNDSQGRPRIIATSALDGSSIGVKGGDRGDDPSPGLMILSTGTKVGVFDAHGKPMLLK